MLMFQMLTYAELAQALSIKQSAAETRVRRHRWRKVLGNDGRQRIEVPVEALPQQPVMLPQHVAPDTTQHAPSLLGPEGATLSERAIRAELAVEHSERLIEELRGRAERAEAALVELRERASRAEHAEAQVGLLQRRLDRVEAALATSQRCPCA